MWSQGRPELMLLLLFNAMVGMEAGILKTIYFPAQKLSWDDARQFCQKNYIDMVTWDTIDPDLLTKWLREEKFSQVWIGLHEDPQQMSVWRWINVKTGEGLTGEDVSQSNNWANIPQSSNSCGSYDSKKKKWHGTACSETLQFICYDDNLVLVTENKTWERALDHCRKMSSASQKYDLLSISRSSDFSYVSDRIYRATTEEVWTGLRFLGGEWWWSDGAALNLQDMLPECPSPWKHCGTVPKNNTDDFTRDCSERSNFICSYEEVAGH